MRYARTGIMAEGRRADTAVAPQRYAYTVAPWMIDGVLTFGRVIEGPGVIEHCIEGPEVRFWRRRGVTLDDLCGVHVLCASDGRVLAAYHDLACGAEGPPWSS